MEDHPKAYTNFPKHCYLYSLRAWYNVGYSSAGAIEAVSPEDICVNGCPCLCGQNKRHTPGGGRGPTAWGTVKDFRRWSTHSLFRLSRPRKAPFVSSIVPEISLWSSSLKRRQKTRYNQFLRSIFFVRIRERENKKEAILCSKFPWQN